MPNTAVATGQVDFILTPQKIAQKIAEISRHPYIVDRLFDSAQGLGSGRLRGWKWKGAGTAWEKIDRQRGGDQK